MRKTLLAGNFRFGCWLLVLSGFGFGLGFIGGKGSFTGHKKLKNRDKI